MIVGLRYVSPDTFPACFTCVPTKHIFAFLSHVSRTDCGFFVPQRLEKLCRSILSSMDAEGEPKVSVWERESPLRAPQGERLCSVRSSRWMTLVCSHAGWMNNASCSSTELCSCL